NSVLSYDSVLVFFNNFNLAYSKVKKIGRKGHPRLFLSKGDASKILKKAKTDPLLQELISLLRRQANGMLRKGPIYPQGSTATNLRQSRQMEQRMITLSLAYLFFNDKKYAEKVEEELLNISRLKSWHPEHFL